MPLGATKLYLFGISVDQQFRTEYLTRLTDTAALHDMTYFGLPPYLPARVVLDRRPGRGADRDASVGDVQAVGDHLDHDRDRDRIRVVVRMIRFELALIVTVATAAATLAYSPAEPYAAIITVLLPPMLVLAWSGLRGGARSGGWAAVVAVGIFLGVRRAVLHAARGLQRVHDRDHGRGSGSRALAGRTAIRSAAAAGSDRGDREAIALIGWLPYLLAAMGDSPAGSGTAQHYLPSDGAQLSFPMLQFTLLGGLCMIGTLWLAVRARSSTRAGALAIGVLAVYAWSLLSMLTTLLRTTLLSFRLQPTLTVLLAAAGAFGFVEAAVAVARRYSPSTGRRIIAAAGALGAVGALGFSQDIPNVLQPDLIVAYTDTDGYGQRADRRPPSAVSYYSQIDAKIRDVTGKPRNEVVVLTADYSFLSIYPYWGFQGLTSHYANPLAQFDKRAAAIQDWAGLKTADQFIAALDGVPWAPPSVFLMRWGANDTYTLRLASDVYPNQPNVKRYQVAFDEALFADPRFSVTTIGPFVLAVRK